MFKVNKRLKDASIAHRLLNYKGACENLHGHNYHFEIEIESNKLDIGEMVIDFNIIKSVCDKYIQQNWDHSVLVADEDLELLEIVKKMKTKCFVFEGNTTAEKMSKHLFEVFSNSLNSEDIKVSLVRIWETESSFASYGNN